MHSLAHLPPFVPALRRAALVAAFALAATPLMAQTTPPATSSDKLAVSPMFLDVQFEHDFSASLKSGAAGNLTSNSILLQLGEKIDMGVNHFTLGITNSYINYSFGGINPVPFSNVAKLGFLLHHDIDLNDQWKLFAQVNAGFAADTKRTLTSGFQYSVAAGPTYVVSPNLTISAGPMFYSRMEDTDTVTPYADVTWTPLAQWTFRAYAGISNGVSAAYDIFDNKATIADASVEYNSRWFRAQDTAAGLKQAVDETDTTIKIGIRQALSPACFIRGYVSAILGREYQFHTNGHSANSADVNSIFGIGIEIGGKF